MAGDLDDLSRASDCRGVPVPPADSAIAERRQRLACWSPYTRPCSRELAGRRTPASSGPQDLDCVPMPDRTQIRLELAYLIVTGTTTAPRALELARALLELVPQVLTLMTPNAARVIAPRDLSAITGTRLIESYFDEAILPRPPEGLVMVAPCSFNSLNKLASGVADNLALSLVAEAIGRLTPVVVAPSLNAPLLCHPLTSASMAALRGWGVSVVDPEDDGSGPRLARTEVIVAEAARRLASWRPASGFPGRAP